ncbi:hypothetical protein I79_013691 [Cricetulus griseus]|uniref:Uncharacterized protein n=1 Tax=Cricetulus griseus TaxID=10029 RepID=G3HS65_CRIGR|nr:hypothetical protein I79_013691 [Cricetulus griseus]
MKPLSLVFPLSSLCLFVFVFQGSVSLCSLCCAEIRSVDQADSEIRLPLLPGCRD